MGGGALLEGGDEVALEEVCAGGERDGVELNAEEDVALVREEGEGFGHSGERGVREECEEGFDCGDGWR